MVLSEDRPKNYRTCLRLLHLPGTVSSGNIKFKRVEAFPKLLILRLKLMVRVQGLNDMSSS